MYLSSLTLRGFKSFASATTLRFEPGITCVVGPNGSGKSNVVDAIAWVLGEQGAKTLRGGAMADVIFAGTSTRAPLGRAEVVLTFDNSDGAIGEGTAEVSVTRTMFRAGGSEYAINGRPCRLLDVQELLGDSGIGRELHVVVGQGRVDAVLQATPEERRSFIEEAAGVLKHRKRKEKALRKLETMDGNLVRLADVTAEIARSLKPLGRQAETARQARRIAADARDARLRLLADDVAAAGDALGDTLGGHHGPGPAARRLAEVASRLATAERDRHDADERAHGVVPLAAAWSEQLGRARAVHDRLRGIARVADERARLLTDPLAAPGSDVEQVAASARRARAEADQLAEQTGLARRQLDVAAAARAAAETAHEQAERSHRELAAERARHSETVARLRGQVHGLRGQVESADAEAARTAAAVAAAEERRGTAAAQFAGLRQEGAAGAPTGDRGEDPVAAAVAAHEQAVSAHAVAAGALRDAEQSERVAERERAALAARRDALASTTVPADATATVLDTGTGVLGLLSSMIRVRSGYEHAVAAALGPDADAVALASVDDAVTAVEALHDSAGGRVALVVPSRTPRAGQRTLPGLGELDPIELPDGALPATDVVSGRGNVADWARHRLARTVVVDDLATGRELLVRAGAAADAVVVVTLLGDVLGVDSLRGGSGAAPSLIERQAVLDEAGTELDEADTLLNGAQADVAAARAVEAAARLALADAEQARSALDARMSALAERLGAVSAQMRAAADEVDRGRAAAEQIAVRRAGHAAELGRSEEALAQAGADFSLGGAVAAEADAAAADEVATDDDDTDGPPDVRALAVAAREARQVETDTRLAARTLEERSRAAADRAAGAERSVARAQAEQQARVRRDRARTAAAAVAREVLADAAHAVEAAVQVLGRVDVAAAAARDAREQATADATEVGRVVAALAAEHGRLVETSHAEELARTEQRLRLEQLVQVARDEHGFEPDALVDQYGPEVGIPAWDQADDADRGPEVRRFDRGEQQRRLRAAERGLASLGSVNPLAMEEYTALEERHRYLLQQQQDLTSSKRDLLGIIRDVDARVEEVVAAAYADTAREFETLVPRLFPGGTGRLVLTEPDDILSTGIEVEARPAGKTVKRMSLLSGGERTLVALAFLVAIFKARPSPFYVLDEIEAALDDANLDRLLLLMAELRESSQLVVVTHQKRTMEAADALYGVTMRGDGVSTVVGQRLREVV